jgi:hypothetical protein
LPLLFLFSCGDQEKQEGQDNVSDTVSKQQETDTGKTEKKDSIPAVEQPIVLNDLPKTREVNELLKYFLEKYSVNYTETHPDELKVYVLDRFGCDKKYRIVLQKKIPVKDKDQEVFPVAEIRAYIYKDSAQCANAVNNWFNCFGDNCEIIQPGVPSAIQSSPGFYIINEKNIVSLDHKPAFEKNNWKNMNADLRKLFANRQSQIIEVRAKGELVWVQSPAAR